MSIVQSNNYFRYTNPETPTINLVLELPKPVTKVRYTDVNFVDSIKTPHQGGLDVLKAGTIMSNPQTLTASRDYNYINGSIVTTITGIYTLRTYEDPMVFSQDIIEIKNFMSQEDRELLGLGVPFYPEVLDRPYLGYARVSNDKLNLCYIPRFLGDDGFSYRLVNVYGQVTEPSCVFIKTVENLEQYYIDLEKEKEEKEKEAELPPEEPLPEDPL